MKIKVLYKTGASTGYVGEEDMSKDEYDIKIRDETFEFGLNPDVNSKYDRGKFVVKSAVEDVAHNTEETKTFIVRDFQMRERASGEWLSYAANEFTV